MLFFLLLEEICEAKINNIDVVVSAVNFSYIGGSISCDEGENVLASVQTAIEKKLVNKDAIYESLVAFKRAGANAIVSYYADRIDKIIR